MIDVPEQAAVINFVFNYYEHYDNNGGSDHRVRLHFLTYYTFYFTPCFTMSWLFVCGFNFYIKVFCLSFNAKHLMPAAFSRFACYHQYY